MLNSFSSTLATLSPRSARHSQSGQVALIILLMMVVILTVGLSLAARTTQDLFLSKQTSDSTRVFDAAETGADQGLVQLQNSFQAGGSLPAGSTNVTINQSDVNFQITKNSTLDAQVFQGSLVMINVVDRSASPNGLASAAGSPGIQIDWGAKNIDAACTAASGQPASLLISIYSISGGTTNVRYQAIAGCTNRNDNFTPSGGTPAAAYYFRYTLPLQVGDLFVRIRPIYNDTQMSVQGANFALPTPYYTVSSQAKNQTGNETRKIQINRTLPTAPGVMDFALLSGGQLAQ